MNRHQIFAFLIVALAACPIRAELPSESELPRQRADAAQALPSESELPHVAEVTPPAVERQPDEKGAAKELPDEGALPPESDADPALEPAGALPLAGSPDGIPWLRLNLRGHTAPVRAIEFTDSNRFCTAGDDKSVIVWSRDPAPGSNWQYERTIRWQIQRGTRGRIYSLASATGLLAIGGEGAMGGTGEIVLVDPASGDFVATLFNEQDGHRQVVVALNFVGSSDGPALASQSMDGRTLLWNKNAQGLWRPRIALVDDRAAGGDDALAQRLLAGRVFSAIVALDTNRVIVPVYDRTEQGRIVWRLELVDVSNGTRAPLGGAKAPRLVDSVSEMVADAARSKLVAADATGRVFIWDLKSNPPTAQPLNRTNKSSVASLALSPDGKTLIVGCVPTGNSKAAVEVWDFTNPRSPRMKASFPDTKPALAAAISPGSHEIVTASGESVVVRQLVANSPESILRGAAEIPLRVAFAAQDPLYQIGIGTKKGDNGKVAINHTFDTDQLRLSRSDVPNEKSWLPADWQNGGWRVLETTGKQPPRTWSFEQAGARRAQLPLTEERTGIFRSVCWIPGTGSNKPTLAAIGTSAGSILVMELKSEGEAPIVRRFRGHTSDVTSLAVSRDSRWLVSASTDATVCVWPLGDVKAESETVNRWGATFEVNDAGQLVVASIREDGPLYFRGAREGDEVAACHWAEGKQKRDLTDPQQLMTFLTEVTWDQVVEFELRTGRQATRRFQILPAWQQIVSLVMDEDGEWAYWAPSGYYDASFEGHRLFGWQINRGLDELPDFFLAAQFRGVLERSAVMSRLLRTGTIEAAFRQARVESPADSAQTIANTYRLKPEVTILAPEDLKLGGDKNSSTLRAQIRVPSGQQLERVKAFANGVVAPEGRLVDSKVDGTHDVQTYEWNLSVPSDHRVLVQVTAATDNEIAATDSVVVENSAEPSTRKPRLFLLAAGIDDYKDAQIPKLHTPVAHVKSLTDLLRSQSSGLYQVEASSMLDARATRPAWELLTKLNADKLREQASPDDLLVIYLSGHGVQDTTGDSFQFVTANADYTDVMSGSYAECLSSDDFSQFVDIPCRKLVILDTCHGGAIQPLRHREMKLAVRALQQDLLLTLTASDGAEEAVEGRFSTRLLEGLQGAADRDDGNGDGVVRLDELVAYIKRTIGEDSVRDAVIQTPSAGPIDLLPFVTPPLSEAAKSDRVGRLDVKSR